MKPLAFVNHTPSPQTQYPVTLEEAYAAIKWIAENGKSINGDTTLIANAGDSVSGNIAIAVTLLVKDCGRPKSPFKRSYILALVLTLTPNHTRYTKKATGLHAKP